MPDARLQTFDETSDPSLGKARVAALRAELQARGLAGFVVPRSDQHQNEYVPKAEERLAWLTGFSGSAGIAVVLADRAAIFVDGRYTVQVREQVDAEVFSPESWAENPPETWIGQNLAAGAVIGFDPWLHTPAQVEKLARAVEAAGGKLIPVDSNPIDAVWMDRPAPPLGAVTLHPAELAGEAAPAKLAAVQMALGGLDGLMVSDPHAMAWLMNMRGADVSFTPLPLCYGFVPREGRPTLYVDGRKLSNAVRDGLKAVADIAPPDRLVADLERRGAAAAKIRFDASTVASKLVGTLEAAGGAADIGSDPIALLKAAKTEAERAGARAAHRRDAAALANFLAWFARRAPKGGLTEIAAAEALEDFRKATGFLKDLSFPAIAGFGPHAAIPHYRVSTASNLPIGQGIFLIDSGAQYEDGTTDITRTIAVGPPDDAMRTAFTRVLKGHIAVARLVFPRGTSGAQIDPFARQALWQAGLDFDHGTGHGVGAYLSVHEGPARISKLGTVPLAEGMILSNEPGYYKAGLWGIRIENLLLVESRSIEGAERPMLGFETISFAPIDRSLVDPGLMTPEEIAWLDAYHAKVQSIVTPLVEPDVATWLEAATAPLG